MRDHKWDEVIYLGDFMDFDQISHFNKDALRKVEGKRLIEDYAKGNAILDRHQAIVRSKNRNAKFTLLEGNHEYRMERYIDANPNLEGLMEVEQCLKLKSRGIKYIKSWSNGELYKVGKAYFSHGLYTNKYHASKMADNFGVNIYYGHTHDVMSQPKVIRGKDKTIEGSSLGCLCNYNLSYIRGNPTNWQQAFAVMHLLPNGYYNLYSVKIFQHSFVSPEGDVYT